MTKLAEFIEWKTVQGTAVTTPYFTITPESQALIIKFPFGGIVWQRPTAVLVRQGEKTERHPIIDVTRLAAWSMLGASLLLSLLLRGIKKVNSG